MEYSALRSGQHILRYHIGAISTNSKQIYSGIIDAFLTSIRNRIEPPITGIDGRNTLACLEAAWRSSENGTWQQVDLI